MNMNLENEEQVPNGAAEPEVLYEDADVLVVNKPAGWLTH